MKFSFLDKFINSKSYKNQNKINKNNLYIFPNKKGFQIAILVFFCFAVGILYQNNFALLLSIILFIIFFISILISYQNLNMLEFKLLNNLVPSNKDTILNFEINNNNKERININFEQNNEIKNLDIIEPTKISFKNKFQKRGIYETPQINSKSKFPFGIINTFALKKK